MCEITSSPAVIGGVMEMSSAVSLPISRKFCHILIGYFLMTFSESKTPTHVKAEQVARGCIQTLDYIFVNMKFGNVQAKYRKRGCFGESRTCYKWEKTVNSESVGESFLKLDVESAVHINS